MPIFPSQWGRRGKIILRWLPLKGMVAIILASSPLRLLKRLVTIFRYDTCVTIFDSASHGLVNEHTPEKNLASLSDPSDNLANPLMLNRPIGQAGWASIF